MKRRLHIRKDAEPGESDPRLMRIPAWVYWTALTLLVFVLVFKYDRHETAQARDHVDTAQRLEREENYAAAIQEYERALTNPRLGRKAKAQVAVAIADICYERYEDYGRAAKYLLRAKQLDARIADDSRIERRLQQAKARAETADPAAPTTATIMQRVELIKEPDQYRTGPVIFRYKGEEIRAGELERVLRDSEEYRQAMSKSDRAAVERLAKQYVDRKLVYRAGVDAGMHREPDITHRLFTHQLNIVSERYRQEAQKKATIVPNEQVDKYYREHRNEFVTDGRVSVAWIRTSSEQKAGAALDMLRSGTAFGDAATSMSEDAATASQQGALGYISEKDPVLPGLGPAPQVIGKLLEMNPGDVSGITRVGSSFCIFKVLNKVPRNEKTLDEVRGTIERRLRENSVERNIRNAAEELSARYSLETVDGGVDKFMEFTARRSHKGTADGATSAAAATTAAATLPAGGAAGRP